MSNASLPDSNAQSPISLGKLKIQIRNCHLNVDVKKLYVIVTLGDQRFVTSISEHKEGQWNEIFELGVNFHAQLFGTLQLDVYESCMLLRDKHIGRAEIRLRYLADMPDEFDNYYEIWDKRLSTGASSSVGRSKTMAGNVGAVYVKITQTREEYSSIPAAQLPERLSDMHTVPTSLDLLTEEQLATEFKRHLKFQRERKSIGIQFEKHEDRRQSTNNDIDYDTIQPSSDSNSDEDDDDATASRPLRAPLLVQPEKPRQASSMSSKSSRPTTPPSSISTMSLNKPLQAHGSDMAQNQGNFEGFLDEPDNEDAGSFPVLDSIGPHLMTKDTNQVLKTIAKLLAAFGQGFELSHLQTLTGFTILEKYYAELPPDRTWDLVEDLSEIDLGSRFWKFSVASYGWKGLNFLGKGNGYFTDAMREHSDALSIVEYLSIPKDNLLAYDLRSSEAFRPSYFIALDQATNAIVLTIRGTMSMFDTMTDLVCEYEPWRGGLVHTGMKASAMWFFRNVAPQLVAYTNEHGTSGLYIIGHSLGAATAAILTIMLVDYLDEFKQGSDGDFTLQCFGYAPACGLSLDLCDQYKEYIQSFVFANDVVSKLSYGSMMDLKELIIASAEAAQYLGMKQILWSSKPEGEEWKAAFERIGEARRRCLKTLENPRLYVAGKIYQFWLDPVPGNDTRIVIERTNAKRISSEVIVQRSILLDHLPTNFDMAFRRAREALMLEGPHAKTGGALEEHMPPPTTASQDEGWITSDGLWNLLGNQGLKRTTQGNSPPPEP